MIDEDRAERWSYIRQSVGIWLILVAGIALVGWILLRTSP